MSEQTNTAFVLGHITGRVLLLVLCSVGYVLILRWLAPDAPAWAKVIAIYIAVLHADLAMRLGDLAHRLK